MCRGCTKHSIYVLKHFETVRAELLDNAPCNHAVQAIAGQRDNVINNTQGREGAPAANAKELVTQIVRRDTLHQLLLERPIDTILS